MREERAKNTAPLYDVNVVQESSLQRVKFFFSSDATILFLIKAKKNENICPIDLFVDHSKYLGISPCYNWTVIIIIICI